MEELNFNVFLRNIKIDEISFKKKDSKLFEEWKNLFNMVHVESFKAQKHFLINKIRRQFPLSSAAD